MASVELETETPQAVRCWIEDGRVCIELADERTISFPASKFPRLVKATPQLLRQVVLRVQGRALRWENLDEDIWVGDVLAGKFPGPR
jgi:hypothetical protein